MFQITYAKESDWHDYLRLDRHLSEEQFERKIRGRECCIIRCDGAVVGVMRYQFLFDSIPFLTLLFLEESYRGRGFGSRAMQFWEEEMRGLGHGMVMTSTRVDERAQHFYRARGYLDRGGIYFDHTPFEQPQELFLIKVLSGPVRGGGVTHR